MISKIQIDLYSGNLDDSRPIVVALQYIEVGTTKKSTFRDGISADKICNCAEICRRVHLSIRLSGAWQFLFLRFWRRINHFPSIFCCSGTPCCLFFEAELVLVYYFSSEIISLPERFWIEKTSFAYCQCELFARHLNRFLTVVITSLWFYPPNNQCIQGRRDDLYIFLFAPTAAVRS